MELMAAVAVSGKLRAPTWENELMGLLSDVPRLIPAARLAVGEVLESLLAEHTLSTGEKRSIQAVLTTLRQPRLI